MRTRADATSGSSEAANAYTTSTGPPILNPDLTTTDPLMDNETSTPFPDEKETTESVEDEVSTERTM